MPLNFSRLDPNAVAPARKHAADAGVDVFANEAVTIWPFSFKVVHTGVTFEIPEGTVVFAWPKGRSNYLVGAGVIDAGYQGEILIKVVNPSWKFLHIQKGAAIAQLVQVPVICEPLRELPQSEIHAQISARGASGGIHTT